MDKSAVGISDRVTWTIETRNMFRGHSMECVQWMGLANQGGDEKHLV